MDFIFIGFMLEAGRTPNEWWGREWYIRDADTAIEEQGQEIR